MRLVCEEKHIVAQEDFCALVARESGQEIEACYQCGKCTASCPLALSMNLMPNQIIRGVQLGLKDLVLESNAIWHCAACETCASRCPRNIDMARVNKALARLAWREKRVPKDPAVAAFHRSFVESMARWGRAHELEVVALTKLRTPTQWLKDLLLGALLFSKGRLSILPHWVERGARKIRQIVRCEMTPVAEQKAESTPASAEASPTIH